MEKGTTAIRRPFTRFAARWQGRAKPTGNCIYAGWSIASAMDVVVAADDSRFLPHVSEFFTLPWVTGPRRAKQILFANRPLSAEQIKGAVNNVEDTMGFAATIRASQAYNVLGYHGVQGHGDEDDDDPTTVEGKRIGLVGEALEARSDDAGPVRPDEVGPTQS
jgi:hypothetical protein